MQTDRVHSFRLRERLTKVLDEALAKRPLDFKGAFFTVAIKKGGSGVGHIDRADTLFTIVFTLGDFEGANIVFPQLGVEVPLRPGQLLLMNARLLAHWANPVESGERIVVTCFTDMWTAKKGRDLLKFANVKLDDLYFA